MSTPLKSGALVTLIWTMNVVLRVRVPHEGFVELTLESLHVLLHTKIRGVPSTACASTMRGTFAWTMRIERTIRSRERLHSLLRFTCVPLMRLNLDGGLKSLCGPSALFFSLRSQIPRSLVNPQVLIYFSGIPEPAGFFRRLMKYSPPPAAAAAAPPMPISS